MSSTLGVPLEQAAPGSGAAAHRHAGKQYRRFGRIERVLHAGMMFSFTGCALSGLPLTFPYSGWGQALARMMGGFEGAALVHRACAVIMAVVFVVHILQFLWRGLKAGSLLTVLWGPNSLVPQWKDVTDAYEHVKFFLGKGPRPQFDRWTYWEKFDYMAVFWGMFIIGGSGLLLWFVEPLSAWLPGWVFNIATLVHGHEALLAVGFIFTIHFFNGHLRPEKFPMDPVIFTGRISEHEFKEERPLEYERAVREGRLAAMETTPASSFSWTFGRIVGTTGLVLGVLTIVLMLWSLVVH